MIIKTYELQKLKGQDTLFFLLYGENEGFKNQVIKEYFLKNFDGTVERLDENEILSNLDSFLESLMNKSFFEKEKIIIIYRATDKINKLVEKLINFKIDDIKLIINSGALDKKSKLRSFFEKKDNAICIPFYEDNFETLSLIANNFFKTKNIQISQEMVNILVDRSRGDRKNLINELDKISIFSNNKKKIFMEDLIKLTNLAENYSVTELVDCCLSKNSKKTIKILNENNFSSEDCILIIRSLLLKTKRLLKLKKNMEIGGSIDQIISSFRPPIFWKDKNTVKNQILNWSRSDAENLIYKISNIEILVKKNSDNSLNIISDFLLNTSKRLNS